MMTRHLAPSDKRLAELMALAMAVPPMRPCHPRLLHAKIVWGVRASEHFWTKLAPVILVLRRRGMRWSDVFRWLRDAGLPVPRKQQSAPAIRALRQLTTGKISPHPCLTQHWGLSPEFASYTPPIALPDVATKTPEKGLPTISKPTPAIEAGADEGSPQGAKG